MMLRAVVATALAVMLSVPAGAAPSADQPPPAQASAAPAADQPPRGPTGAARSADLPPPVPASAPAAGVTSRAAQAGVAGAVESPLAARVAQVRGMPPAANAAAAGAQRRELDAAWRVFGDYRAESVPLLRRELAVELRAPRPNPVFLLEAGYFLRVYGAESDQPLTKQALLAIEPAAALDGPQLFRFAHAVAAERDPRMLPLLDRAFLRQQVSVPVPQHGAVIDEGGVRVLLYGRFGAEGERHLASLLRDQAAVRPALEVLLLTGSPASVPAVAPLLQSDDVEVFSRAVTFLLRAGGPQGRAALLAVKPQGMSKEAIEFFAPIREQLARQPATQAGQGGLPDAEVRRMLDALAANNGRYDGIDPGDIAKSRLPKEELLARLQAIRERTCARATNEALADIETTSALLNAIQYRDQ